MMPASWASLYSSIWLRIAFANVSSLSCGVLTKRVWFSILACSSSSSSSFPALTASLMLVLFSAKQRRPVVVSVGSTSLIMPREMLFVFHVPPQQTHLQVPQNLYTSFSLILSFVVVRMYLSGSRGQRPQQ